MIGVKVIRACWHAGELLRAGAVVTVDELAAGSLVGSSRCALVDQADAARVQKAEAAEAERVVRAGERSGPPEARPSWTRRT